jgi:Ca2+-binding RTX toxin-like protein
MAIDLLNVAAGAGGFVIHGQDANDGAGRSVSSAGDVNGDGFDDIIIGAEGGDGPGNTRAGAGDSYVVFGKASGFAAEIDLAAVAGGNGGFVIHGQDPGDASGYSVSSAGDVNGDGFDDLIIGALVADGPGNTRDKAGDTYVVFGHAGGFAAEIDLAAVAAGNGGFVMHGENASDVAGFSVSSAGDINGDGFADLIIGAEGGDGPGNTRDHAGASYVVFGHAGGFAAEIDLAAVAAGNGGFVIDGQDAGDSSGWSVSSAGDVNGDGFDDLIIGAVGADGPGNTRDVAGDSYVVFGKASGFAPEIDLAAVAAGNGGFVIHGQDAIDFAGISVSSAGDINGDGFDDLIIGAPNGDGPGNTRDAAGDSYVVFGHAGGFAAEIDLAAVAAGNGGFVIHGEDAGDHSGWSVSSAGDVNGDGFDDLIIGAYSADGPGNTRSRAGDSYVVFGHAGGFAAEIDLAAVAAGNGGFVIHGKDGTGTGHVQDVGDESGFSVSSAGDVNGDGFDDLIIGAWFGNGPGNTRLEAGDSYVLFGSATIGDSVDHITHLGTAANDILIGDTAANDMVGGLGNDILVGNGGADVLRGGAGNDTLVIANNAFLRIAGGDGIDTLAFSGGIIMADADFRQIDGIESIRPVNAPTTLILGTIAAHAIDGLQVTIDGAAVTGAVMNIDGSGLGKALSVNLANDAANVTLRGGSGNDILVGGTGDDFFDGGGGGDVIAGGIGIDTVSYASSALSVGVNLATGLGSGGATGDTLSGIEKLFGSNQGDILTGDDGANSLFGLAGADTLNGGAGDDLLDGGAGNDVAFLGTGNDVFQWGPGDGSDTVEGQDGLDRLDFNGASIAERIDISANGARVRFTRDVGNVAMDLNDVELIRFKALGGVDNVAINDLSGTDVVQAGVHVDLGTSAGGGDGAVDTVTINGAPANEIITVFSSAGVIGVNGSSAPVAIFNAESGDQLVVGGGDGNDTIDASSLPLGTITLTLDGGAGDDMLFGAQGSEALLGGAGNDVLSGGIGADMMKGGAGDDAYVVDNAADIVVENAGEGADTVFSTASFALSPNVENLVLQGGADLQGFGNDLANAIFGNTGNNLIDGGLGGDSMSGGAGNDAYFVDNAGDMVIESAGQGSDTVFASINYALPANVETLVLQGGADLQGFGNGLTNAIFGNSGNNLIDGGAGADIMSGGAGNDTYFVDNAGDVVVEGPNQGNDVVFASVNYALTPDVETLLLQGNADLQSFGNALANTIFGNNGNNLIDGRSGADVMAGGGGNDTYFVDNVADAVVESAGGGSDAVFASVNYGLSDNVETLVLQGGADLQGFGNGSANTIFGNSGNNLIDGGGGADTMIGGLGNDTYFVDNAADAVVESAGQGSDAVFAVVSYGLSDNVESLVLQGAGNINGIGNALVNAMFGNSGDNTLDGQGGADILTGNAGNDTFVFNAGQANGDTVVDFAGNGAAAGDAMRFVGYGAGATFTNIDATHWQVNYNGGAAHDVITFSNGAAIDPSDFLFM